jgi:hypothetical protein
MELLWIGVFSQISRSLALGVCLKRAETAFINQVADIKNGVALTYSGIMDQVFALRVDDVRVGTTFFEKEDSCVKLSI